MDSSYYQTYCNSNKNEEERDTLLHLTMLQEKGEEAIPDLWLGVEIYKDSVHFLPLVRVQNNKRTCHPKSNKAKLKDKEKRKRKNLLRIRPLA